MDITLDGLIKVDHRMVKWPEPPPGQRASDVAAQFRLGGGGAGRYVSEVIHSAFDFAGERVNFVTHAGFQRVIIHRLCSCMKLEHTSWGHPQLTHRRARAGRRPGCGTPQCIFAPLAKDFDFWSWSTVGHHPGLVLWATPVSSNGGVEFERRLSTLFPEIDPLMFAMVGNALAWNFNRLLQGAFLMDRDREAWSRTLDSASHALTW